ncbi:MAG TPA: LacI family DNA-binding transcriptional regulator, partial [Pseudacidobacterium sp.]|nr:LacI family DNA-binding transcriptional regulator [Pseudacidobacterium sp.]
MQAANTGIKDIAKALKISIGTVDRALHDRPGVSEKTKARVLQMAERLGYKPNLAAQALKLNRSVSIGAVLPKHISHFFDPMRAGIRDAATATVGTTVNLEFHEFPHLGVGDAEAIETALQRNHDGLILLPGDTRKFDFLIRKILRHGVAVTCVGSDVPNTDRIGSVATHA